MGRTEGKLKWADGLGLHGRGRPPLSLSLPPIHHVCLPLQYPAQPLDIQHISIKGRGEQGRREGSQGEKVQGFCIGNHMGRGRGGTWPSLPRVPFAHASSPAGGCTRPLMLFSLYSAAATADGPPSRGCCADCGGRNGDGRACPPALPPSLALAAPTDERRPRDIGRGRIGGGGGARGPSALSPSLQADRE